MKSQKELEAMSDIDLCKILFNLEDRFHSGWKIDEELDGVLFIRFKDEVHYKEYMPTKTPNDIIPLVIEHKIDLVHKKLGVKSHEIVRASFLKYHVNGDLLQHKEVSHKNPYRAATIVLILLLQGEE
ncbi:MAG: hypothetical protein QM500_18220 [Methylococcales bacterium]